MDNAVGLTLSAGIGLMSLVLAVQAATLTSVRRLLIYHLTVAGNLFREIEESRPTLTLDDSGVFTVTMQGSFRQSYEGWLSQHGLAMVRYGPADDDPTFIAMPRADRRMTTVELPDEP